MQVFRKSVVLICTMCDVTIQWWVEWLQGNLSSELSELSAALSMRGTLERMYHAFRMTRAQLLDETGAVISQLEGRQESGPASPLPQERAGLSFPDESILDWNIITFLDRTALSTGIVHLAASVRYLWDCAPSDFASDCNQLGISVSDMLQRGNPTRSLKMVLNGPYFLFAYTKGTKQGVFHDEAI